MSSTETADENVDLNGLSPPKKRTKRNHLSSGEKNIILNIYKSEMLENPTSLVDEVVKRVANKVGTSCATVYRVIREYKQTHTLSEPKTNQNRKNSLDLVDEFDRNAIRRKVHQFFFKNEVPTIDKVLEVVNADNDLPTFKRSTFYKLLKKLNFVHERRGRNSMLMDRDEIKIWRREYLKKIKSYRNEKRKIYYLDETWVNAGHVKSKVWNDKTITSSKQAFLSGLSTGLKNPTGDFT